MLDPAKRMLGHPGGADLLGSGLGVTSTCSGLQLRPTGLINSVAPRGGFAIGEGGIFARRRVAVVVEQVHRFVVAKDDGCLAAFPRGLLLQLLQRADDFQ